MVILRVYNDMFRQVIMRRSILSFLFVTVLAGQVLAQGALRDIEKEIVPTTMFQVTYAALFPGFDTRADYGFSNTIGGSIIYKTDNNWLFTANGNLIFGNKIKGSRIDLLGEGITTVDGEIIGGGGLFTDLAVYQRGFLFQAEVGKLISYKPNPNSGFFVQGGVGYLRNRTRIDFQVEMQNTPYPVYDDYQYGYDKMRGGVAFHAETGYLMMGNSKIFNWSVSLEMTYARTHDMRDYDFRVFYDAQGQPVPVGPTNPDKRYNDFYYGIRLSWMIPTYERRPEAYYYN